MGQGVCSCKHIWVRSKEHGTFGSLDTHDCVGISTESMAGSRRKTTLTHGAHASATATHTCGTRAREGDGTVRGKLLSTSPVWVRQPTTYWVGCSTHGAKGQREGLGQWKEIGSWGEQKNRNPLFYFQLWIQIQIQQFKFEFEFTQIKNAPTCSVQTYLPLLFIFGNYF